MANFAELYHSIAGETLRCQSALAAFSPYPGAVFRFRRAPARKSVFEDTKPAPGWHRRIGIPQKIIKKQETFT
jgi:hypothetical protein